MRKKGEGVFRGLAIDYSGSGGIISIVDGREVLSCRVIKDVEICNDPNAIKFRQNVANTFIYIKKQE